MNRYTIHHGNNLDVLPTIPDNSIDSIVTDPPYELGFMGKKWDATGIAYNVTLWAECLRVLKPGGHLLAFGGTRTYHRMACAIEDAGFEIRDSIHWIYGSGFPKSLDVSKAINKAAGAEREVVGTGQSGKTRSVMNAANYPDSFGGDYSITAPATDEARNWQGWGTALKPAHEPIVLARKPLIGTVAGNVLTHGTGALNIDGCRIHRNHDDTSHAGHRTATFGTQETNSGGDGSGGWTQNDAGRWPANVIHDGSDEIVDLFPHTAATGSGKVSGNRQGGGDGPSVGLAGQKFAADGYSDSGSAARFFYCAKPSKAERNAGLDALDERQTTGGGGLTATVREDGSYETASAAGKYGSVKAKQQNHHPTVKPLALMRYLVRLVTPPGGTILDPFAGSGTTLAAAILENTHPIGIELTPDYHPIIHARCQWATNQPQQLL